MIVVSRLNGKRFVLNAEMIRAVESNPDTTVVLINGERVIVRETMEEIVGLAIDYRRSLRMLPAVEV